MIPQWIIERKRDGGEIPEKDLREFIGAYAEGSLPDYQMAAFAMAVFFKGMTFEELSVMTDAMMRSGDVLDFSGLSRPTVDKHSTGGIGDKISIPLAPLVAAAGAAVPMISGRGLGITGGTLDKLESIPGYNTQLTTAEFRKVLEKVGCSIIGQTSRLAPADKKLYALRDVTGTVPSIPLISSSIMSKKLAEGAQGLVLDVKFGAGAFMKDIGQARKLAETMVAIGQGMGRDMSALVTDMGQPLGRAVGNALEIAESIDVLRGEGPEDVVELTVALAAEMLALSGISANVDEGEAVIRKSLASGAGLEAFAKMVKAHGGDAKFAEKGRKALPKAPVCVDVASSDEGFVSYVDADAIGRVVLLLGGGRTRSEDSIDHAVGIDRLVKAGESVSSGDALMRIHARSEEAANEVREMAARAVVIGDVRPKATPLVAERMRG